MRSTLLFTLLALFIFGTHSTVPVAAQRPVTPPDNPPAIVPSDRPIPPIDVPLPEEADALIDLLPSRGQRVPVEKGQQARSEPISRLTGDVVEFGDNMAVIVGMDTFPEDVTLAMTLRETGEAQRSVILLDEEGRPTGETSPPQ